MSENIGAFEAKTRLPELLRAVREGKRFTITVRGVPVATLAPVAAHERSETAVASMLSFSRSRPAFTGDLKDLLAEGRA